MVEKFATVPVAKLATPWQFGPSRRMPARRAVSAIDSSIRRPSAPVSPNPEAMTTAAFTPRAAHASTAATASAPATATIASSGVSGTRSRLGKAGRSWTTCLPGFTG